MLNFYPKQGMVLSCDFKGYIAPEIVKTRNVVVISPASIRRHNLVTVVPLSTTSPDPVELYHYLLKGNPIPKSREIDIWAKCDLVATVSIERLDRIKVARGVYEVGRIGSDQIGAIRCAVARSIGIVIVE